MPLQRSSHQLCRPPPEGFVEYVTETPRTMLDDVVVEAAALSPSLGDVHRLAEHVADFVRTAVTYEPGATSVQSTAAEAWARGAEVCEDISDATLANVEALGVPARYVCRCLYPATEPTVGVPVLGMSLAWVEGHCEDWVGIDPTNGLRETPRHVVVARGGAYDDVPPLKGVSDGTGSTKLGVVVEMTALAR